MDDTFAKRFRKERKKLGLTQEELANKLGISKRTISNWETGQTKPFLNEIVKEGIDIGYLITGIPTNPECLQQLRQAAIHGKLPEESKEAIILKIKQYLDYLT